MVTTIPVGVDVLGDPCTNDLTETNGRDTSSTASAVPLPQGEGFCNTAAVEIF